MQSGCEGMKEMKIILWIICCDVVLGSAGCEAKKGVEPNDEIIAQSTSYVIIMLGMFTSISVK
jgi:hypothetical protein